MILYLSLVKNFCYHSVMSKYLITGRQGSGKTTVIKELQHRGYTAYNTDDLPEVTKLQNIVTGEAVDWPKGPVDWTKYAWNWQKDKFTDLLSSNETVFIDAITSNQEAFYPMFNNIFALILSPENLRIRLNQHEHDSHHLPGQIDRWVKDHEIKQQKFVGEGFIAIDADKSVDEVTNQILTSICGSKIQA
jgi:hypothetical protein